MATSALKCFGRLQCLLNLGKQVSHVRCASVKKMDRQTLLPKDDWVWRMPEGCETGIKVNNSYQSVGKMVPLVFPNPNYVTWYACGPTVYDSSHIGHASTYLQFDLIRRILTKYFGLNICLVMGITNIDNKIINRALLYDRDIMEVANTYEKEFFKDMQSLNVLPPTAFIRVTEIIPHIIHFIEDILAKKQAYVTEKGNVYFEYKSAHQPITKLSKAFYEPDITVTEKRFEKDICLWKSANPGEPYWDSPWGKGRPGWHIECSTIASMCFGDKVDIHTGAKDLRFPHHEYEVAQCDSYHGCQQWVNYFLHTGHVVVRGGDKMSKSLGNFLKVSDFVKNARHPDILRLLCCHNKYTKSFKISDHQDNADQVFELVTSVLKQCREIVSGRIRANVNNQRIEQAVTYFEKSILDDFKRDFNISDSFIKLKKLIKQVETGYQLQDDPSDVRGMVRAIHTIETFLDNLGFTFHKDINT